MTGRRNDVRLSATSGAGSADPPAVFSNEWSLDDPTPDPGSAVSRPQVGRDTITTLAFRLGGLPFTFGVTVVTSRYLLPTGRGAFVLALLTVTIAATLLGNVGTAATHELSRKEVERHLVVGQALLMSVVLGLLGMLALFPIDYALADQGFRRVSFVAAGLPGLLLVQTLSAALVGVGRLALANLIQFALTFVTLAGMLGFVLGIHRGTTGAVVAWVMAQTVVAALGLLAARDLWWPLQFGALPARRRASMLMLGIRLGLVNLVGQLNYRIELIILQVFHGLAQVGLYSLAISLAELLWLVAGALAAATVAPVVAAVDDAAAAAVVASAVRWALLGTALGGLGVGLGGWFLVVPIFGSPFESSIHPLLLLLPGVVAFAPGVLTAVYFSMRLGRTRYPLQGAVVSLCVTTVLAIVLVPGHLGVGAAVACSAGYGISGVLNILWFARETRVPARDLVPSLADVKAVPALMRGLLPG